MQVNDVSQLASSCCAMSRTASPVSVPRSSLPPGVARRPSRRASAAAVALRPPSPAVDAARPLPTYPPPTTTPPRTSSSAVSRENTAARSGARCRRPCCIVPAAGASTWRWLWLWRSTAARLRLWPAADSCTPTRPTYVNAHYHPFTSSPSSWSSSTTTNAIPGLSMAVHFHVQPSWACLQAGNRPIFAGWSRSDCIVRSHKRCPWSSGWTPPVLRSHRRQ